MNWGGGGIFKWSKLLQFFFKASFPSPDGGMDVQAKGEAGQEDPTECQCLGGSEGLNLALLPEAPRSSEI